MEEAKNPRFRQVYKELEFYERHDKWEEKGSRLIVAGEPKNEEGVVIIFLKDPQFSEFQGRLQLSMLPNEVLRIELIETTLEGEFARFSSTPYTTIDVNPVSDCNITLQKERLSFNLKGDRVHHILLSESPISLRYEIQDGPTIPILSISDFWLEHTYFKNAFLKDLGKPLTATFHGKESVIPRGPTGVGIKVTYYFEEKGGIQPRFYGLAERIQTLKLNDTYKTKDTKIPPKGHPYRLYNQDHFIDEHPEQTIYGSVPLLFTSNPGAPIQTGLFYSNASDTLVDLDEGKYQVRWTSEAGALDLFIFTAADQGTLNQRVGQLNGTPVMPNIFSLGYHQCRWNYFTEDEVINDVLKGFNEHDIPLDSIWLDIDHTDGKRYTTWKEDGFPNGPTKMVEALGERGRKLVCIVDPHIKNDPDWDIQKELREKELYVKDKDGKPMLAECWPGESLWGDYFNPACLEFWGSLYSLPSLKGVHIWNDMNEPATTSLDQELSIPKSSLHIGNVEHREAHNVYGVQVVKGTYEGLLKRDPNERPFILARSFSAGSQRYTSVWTADCMCSWEHLRIQIPMLLANSLCGQGFSGSDIPGFYDDPESEQLYIRWYQLGLFMPFFRAHSNHLNKRREPWLFSESTLNSVRKIVKLRYSLLPYLYNVAHQMYKTGEPAMRPIWYHNRAEPLAYQYEDVQFYYGRDIIVRPITFKNQQSANVYLPTSDIWYSTDMTKKIEAVKGIYEMKDIDVDTIGVFVRGGAIVPMKMNVRGSVQQMESVPLTLFVYPDVQGNAELELYIDDGRSMAYESGDSSSYAMWHVKLANFCSLKINRSEGTYKGVNTKNGALEVLDAVIFGSTNFTSIKVNETSVEGQNVNGVLTKIPLNAEINPEKGLEIICST